MSGELDIFSDTDTDTHTDTVFRVLRPAFSCKRKVYPISETLRRFGLPYYNKVNAIIYLRKGETRWAIVTVIHRLKG